MLMTQDFFQKTINSIKEMVNRFHMFSRFSEWRPYLCKWEIAGIRVLNGVKVEVGSMQCVDLVLDTIKISETHFPYNKKLKQEGNFCLIIANIQRVLKLWKLRNLTLEGRILDFTEYNDFIKNYVSRACCTNTKLHSYWTRINRQKFFMG